MRAVFLLLILVPASLCAADDLTTFQANVNKRLTSKPTGYATPFTGIFSITSAEASNPTTPVLMDTKLTMVANSYGDRWVYMDKVRSAVERDRVLKIRQKAIKDLPWHASITFRHGDAPVAMVLYSAVDCGFCRRLEVFLANNGFSYTVFPSSLTPQNFSLAQDVWCNPNPGSAWMSVMRGDAEIPKVERCPTYPIADIRYTGALFSYGNTPGIIFADGTVFRRMPEGAGEQAQFVEEVNAKIKNGIVFDVPGRSD